VLQQRELESPFANGLLAKAAAHIAVFTHTRPSDILEYDGSALERLMFDLAVLKHVAREAVSVEEEVRKKYARLGVYV